jgi:hypothetical protein
MELAGVALSTRLHCALIKLRSIATPRIVFSYPNRARTFRYFWFCDRKKWRNQLWRIWRPDRNHRAKGFKKLNSAVGIA